MSGAAKQNVNRARKVPRLGSRAKQLRRGRVEHLEDRWLMAVVHGDFNNDGFQDMAVGVPGEDVGSLRSRSFENDFA